MHVVLDTVWKLILNEQHNQISTLPFSLLIIGKHLGRKMAHTKKQSPWALLTYANLKQMAIVVIKQEKRRHSGTTWE